MTYSTIDYLPDLESDKMNSAIKLIFKPFVPTPEVSNTTWDNEAFYSTSEDNAILRDTFVFEGKAGATYDIMSNSFLDPFLLELFDNKGNVIAVDKDSGTYGNDYVIGFVAPYDGKYYVNASWHQGLANKNKNVSLLVEEDVNTIHKTPLGTSDADSVFNWAESQYSILFPEHQQSHDIFGYYAREYSNGDAIGVKDDNVYFYDGGSNGTGAIIMVGTVLEYLSQAIPAGF